MDAGYYTNIIKSIRPNKRLGQNFLINRNVAIAEAEHCVGKNVIELGPGLGMLTKELCEVASHVTAIEIDTRLYEFLKHNLEFDNLDLIISDFFDADTSKIKADIMVSNVPYNLSSKILTWLSSRRMQAVLCLQKEFVERMLAKEGTREYSKLSVFSTLSFNATKIMNVPAGSFYPKPKVDSYLVYLKPKDQKISAKEMEILSLIMEHKNKKVRNAIEDSSKALGISKETARAKAKGIQNEESRVSKLGPMALLSVAKELSARL